MSPTNFRFSWVDVDISTNTLYFNWKFEFLMSTIIYRLIHRMSSTQKASKSIRTETSRGFSDLLKDILMSDVTVGAISCLITRPEGNAALLERVSRVIAPDFFLKPHPPIAAIFRALA